MSIAELLALADLVKNETGIGRNNAVRIGMALEEIIKYFRDNGGSGGEPGSADGGVLESISAMNFAPQGKFYGVQLPENHPELGINHFSLMCMRGGSQEELIQVAIGYDGTTIKLWLRGGEVNSYGPFNQISGGGGGTGDEVDPVFAAWKAVSFEDGKLKPSLVGYLYRSVTLLAANWVDKAQTVAVAGVTSTNNILLSPSIDRNQLLAYGAALISCTAQGVDSLTFVCETVPTADITINIKIE